MYGLGGHKLLIKYMQDNLFFLDCPLVYMYLVLSCSLTEKEYLLCFLTRCAVIMAHVSYTYYFVFLQLEKQMSLQESQSTQ